jgi:hypothetical protein
MDASSTSAAQTMEQGAIGAILARVLKEAGFNAHSFGDMVLLPSGLRLQVALLETHNLAALHVAEGRVATATRIVAFNDTCFPAGLPELQHATGVDAVHAMAAGFAAWAQSALVTLEDVVRSGLGAGVRDSTLLAISYPAQHDGEARVYQAILGPIVHVGADEEEASGAEWPADGDELCPACMTTRIQDALREHLSAVVCTGIGLLAVRDTEGALAADCRINGERFEPGVARLLAYAQSWPARGFEYRQQYVVIRPVPATRPN